MGRGSPGTQAIPVHFAFIAMGTGETKNLPSYLSRNGALNSLTEIELSAWHPTGSGMLKEYEYGT
jgi:hypothetical protein